MCDSSDAEVEHDEVDSEDNEEEDEDDDEDEEESMNNIRMNDANTRGRRATKSNFDVMTPSRNAGRGSSGQKRAWKSDNAKRGGQVDNTLVGEEGESHLIPLEQQLMLGIMSARIQQKDLIGPEAGGGLHQTRRLMFRESRLVFCNNILIGLSYVLDTTLL